MRSLSVEDVLYVHAQVIAQSGGSYGLRDLGALESSVAQPMQSFGGVDFYPDIPAKAAALGFFLVSNHPFVDGNKRVGHAALAVTLRLNGYLLAASVDEQEKIMLRVASGELTRAEFEEWVQTRASRPGA
ncbi:MAG TPA: type II toxin-antitoxin system death-on-curing family toxin [Thermoanaerobaculia bacterium]|nr:type II toxin-antitoxin system death-on-curing family toxin [Thermoanaerobaculia bacterium]